MKAKGMISVGNSVLRRKIGVEIEGSEIFYFLQNDDHPQYQPGDEVEVVFDPADQFATIVDDEVNDSPIKITKITVHYQDGSSQVAEIGPEEIECEAFTKDGGLHSAGSMTVDAFVADLSKEIRQSAPTHSGELEIYKRVISELGKLGVQSVSLEYPGYIAIRHNGVEWSAGFDVTWGVSRLSTAGDTVSSVDLNFPATSNDAKAIARAISDAVKG